MKIRYLPRTLVFLFLLSLPVFSQKWLVDSTFAPALNGSVNFIEILSDGKMLIAGDFTTINGVTRNKIARLNADGSLDASFDATHLAANGHPVFIKTMTVLPDGKVLIGGNLQWGGGSGDSRVLRLNADGSLDNTLTSSPYLSSVGDTFFRRINKVEQLPNGKILLCGKFLSPNGNPKPHLARYNNNGTYDPTFTPSIDDECNDVEAQPDGKYLVAGYYNTVNGNPGKRLTRFNTDDSIDTGFDPQPFPNPTGPINYSGIELQGDGKMVVFRAGGCCGNGVSRLNADGSFNTSTSSSVATAGDVAVQSNGKIIVVAEFNNVFGQSFDLNRYNTDGTHDPSQPRMSFSLGFPKAAAWASDGKLVVGGDFNQVSDGSTPTVGRTHLARFTPQAIPIKPKYDFDGDGKDDIAVFRPSDRVWHLNRSTAGYTSMQFGLSTDKPIAYDYDGDGKADIAVFRDGVWYWSRSSNSVFAYRVCGQAGDIPQPGNWNALCLVYRPSAASFYTQQPFYDATPVEFRDMTLLPNDKPVVADYDGDGRDDLAVFRDGNWFFMKINNLATTHYQFGIAGDKPVIGDFDGDLRNDFAVFRPSDGTWYIQKTTEGFYAVRWGLADDLPVPADYDGDGKTDIAVYRPSNGVWYQMRSTGTFHFEHFGLAGDIPAQLR